MRTIRCPVGDSALMLRLQTRKSAGEDETLRQVTALALRLQRESDCLTVEDVEALGAEIGVPPDLMRRALETVRSDSAESQLARETKAEPPSHGPAWGRAWPAWERVAFAAFPLLWLGCGLMMGPALVNWQIWGRPYFFGTLVLSVLGGACARRKRWGLIGGGLVGLGASLALSGESGLSNPVGGILVYTCVAGLLGVLGTWLRSFSLQANRVGDHPNQGETLTRAGMLRALFDLQSRLEAMREHCAFLSVDVAGSSEMKREAPELDVELSFQQLVQWVKETTELHGGSIHSAAGDGMLCAFPGEREALRAARDLLEGLTAFNAQRNRLPLLFRLRVGVSAGRVPVADGEGLGYVHSRVIDRAAELQKSAPPNTLVVDAAIAGAALSDLPGAIAIPLAGDESQVGLRWQPTDEGTTASHTGFDTPSS